MHLLPSGRWIINFIGYPDRHVVYKPMRRGLDQLIASENVIKKDGQIILTIAIERDVLVDEVKLVLQNYLSVKAKSWPCSIHWP